MLPFLGRDRELKALLDCRERSRRGEPQVVRVSGEAGIGKTRLVDEVVAQARADGDTVLRGRCWDLGAAPAFWHWIQAFASYPDGAHLAALAGALYPGLVQLLPGLRGQLPEPPAPAADAAERSQLELFLAAASLLRRLGSERPLLVVLDDLELADLPTLHLLRFLARNAVAGPVMVVALHRPVPDEDPLGELLGGVAHDPGVARLDLAGLAPDAIGRMVEAVTGALPTPALAVALHTRTGGNPLFASEFVRLLAVTSADPARALATVPLPEGVRGVIQQRLGALPERCRRLLAVSAVVGRQFDLGTLAAATGEPTERLLAELTPAIERNVIAPVRGQPLGFAFTHPLIRDGLHQGLEAQERAQLHARVAEALRQRRGEEADELAPEIASHYAAAAPVGTAALAVEYYRRAASRATRVAAPDEAARLLGQALELAAALDDGGGARCEVLVELGEAQARAGRGADATRTFLHAAEEAGRRGLPALAARATLGLGGRFVWTRSDRRIDELALVERSLAELGPDDVAMRVRLLARLVGMSRDLEGAARRRERCREAVELARRAGDPNVLAFAIDALVVAEFAAGSAPEQYRGLVDELEGLARGSDDVERLLQVHGHRAVGAVDAGDTLRAETQVAVARQLAERLGQPAQRWYAAFLSGQVALVRGDLARAEAFDTEALRLSEQLGRVEGLFIHVVQLHAIRREQDRLDELAPFLAEVFPRLERFGPIPIVRAHAEAELGRPEAGRALLDRHAPTAFAEIGDCLQWRYQLAQLCELAERCGHRAAVPALLARLDEVKGRNLVSGGVVSAGAAVRYRGLLALTVERWAEAERCFAQAADENRAGGAPILALRSELDLARASLRQPERQGAGLALLERVARQAAAQGAPGVAAAAERARAEAGGGGVILSGASAAVLRREGDFWIFEVGEASLRLRDTRGLQYLARLLAEPGRELPALELAGGGTGAHPDAGHGLAPEGDLGPLLDGQARAELRRRLGELERLERDAVAARPARADGLRREREAIAAALDAASGLGGRERRIGDPADRARQSVTKALKAAILRIAREHQALGHHLTSAVHTGFSCRYQSDPRFPLDWRVRP